MLIQSSARSFLSVESLGPTEGLLKAPGPEPKNHRYEGPLYVRCQVQYYNGTLWARVGTVQVFSCLYFEVGYNVTTTDT